MTHYLYHICRHEDESFLSCGYIGVTSNIDSRIDRHFSGHGNVIVRNNLNKFGSLSYSIVYEGTLEEVLDLEKKLRPNPRMGWNIAEGGGMPPNAKGRKWNEKQRTDIVAAVSGSNNSKWKGWWIVDGQKYVSLNVASKQLGVCRKTVRDRAKSNKFPNWEFEEVGNERSQRIDCSNVYDPPTMLPCKICRWWRTTG